MSDSIPGVAEDASARPPSSPAPGSTRRRVLRFRPSLVEVLLGLVLGAGLLAHRVNGDSATGAVLRVDDHQVSVVVESFGDGVTVDDTPGYRVVRPLLDDAYAVVKSPAEYVMGGNKWVDHNHAPRLSVRAADGSHVWFEDVRVQYAVIPDRAWDVIRDTGGDYGWRHGVVDAYARAVLRDAFGRFSAEEIVRQENLRTARLEARDRLDRVLAAHGLTVLELTTSSPSFPKEYESVLERREVAEQETLQIDQQLAQLRASREDRLAKLERDKALELQKVEGSLARELARARQDALRKRSTADRSHDEQVAEGDRQRDSMLSRAEALEVTYAQEAEGTRERADALAAKGLMAVRKALVDGLAKVQFEIAPHELPADGGRAGRAAARAQEMPR